MHERSARTGQEEVLSGNCCTLPFSAAAAAVVVVAACVPVFFFSVSDDCARPTIATGRAGKNGNGSDAHVNHAHARALIHMHEAGGRTGGPSSA